MRVCLVVAVLVAVACSGHSRGELEERLDTVEEKLADIDEKLDRIQSSLDGEPRKVAKRSRLKRKVRPGSGKRGDTVSPFERDSDDNHVELDEADTVDPFRKSSPTSPAMEHLPPDRFPVDDEEATDLFPSDF